MWMNEKDFASNYKNMPFDCLTHILLASRLRYPTRPQSCTEKCDKFTPFWAQPSWSAKGSKGLSTKSSSDNWKSVLTNRKEARWLAIYTLHLHLHLHLFHLHLHLISFHLHHHQHHDLCPGRQDMCSSLLYNIPVPLFCSSSQAKLEREPASTGTFSIVSILQWSKCKSKHQFKSRCHPNPMQPNVCQGRIRVFWPNPRSLSFWVRLTN